jgi:TonB family protein
MSQKVKRKKITASGISLAVAEHLTDSELESARLIRDGKNVTATVTRVIDPPRASVSENPGSLQSITDDLCKDTSATGAAIALDVDGQIICVASTGTAPPVGVAIDRATGISGVCLRAAKTIVCDDAESDTRVNRASSSYIRSIIAAPVFTEDRASGLVEILSTSAWAFTPSHVARTEQVARSLEQQCAPAIPSPAVLTSTALLVEPPVFETIGGNDAFAPLTDATIPDRLRSAIALIVSHSRTIAITAVVLALFLSVLWLTLRPRTRQQDVNPQQSQAVTGPEVPARDSLQRQPQPQTIADDVASARTKPRTTKNSTKSDAKATPGPDEEAIILQPAPLDNKLPASSSQVEPPPVLALPSQLSSVQLSSPKAAIALPAPGRSGGQLIYQVKPKYPTFARNQSRSGNVQLLAIVASNGNVSKVEVISGDPLLVAAAVDAVRQWRYKPLLIDGHAVEQRLPVNVVFKARQD